MDQIHHGNEPKVKFRSQHIFPALGKTDEQFLWRTGIPPPFKYLLDPTDEGASSPIIFSSLILLYSIYVSPPSLVNSDRPQHGSPPEIWSNRHCFFTSMTAFLENSHVTCASQLFWFLCDVAANLDESEV